MRSPINRMLLRKLSETVGASQCNCTARNPGRRADIVRRLDAFIAVQPRGLRNRHAARYSRESLLSKHEEAGALRVNVNRQGEARSTSGKNGAWRRG